MRMFYTRKSRTRGIEKRGIHIILKFEGRSSAVTVKNQLNVKFQVDVNKNDNNNDTDYIENK